VLVQGVPNAKSPSGAKLYFLRRVPHDPFLNNPAGSGETTWACGASTARRMRRARERILRRLLTNGGTGLNGVLYKEW